LAAIPEAFFFRAPRPKKKSGGKPKEDGSGDRIFIFSLFCPSSFQQLPNHMKVRFPSRNTSNLVPIAPRSRRRLLGPSARVRSWALDSWSIRIAGFFGRSGRRGSAERLANVLLTEFAYDLLFSGRSRWVVALREGHQRPDFLFSQLRRRFPRFSRELERRWIRRLYARIAAQQRGEPEPPRRRRHKRSWGQGAGEQNSKTGRFNRGQKGNQPQKGSQPQPQPRRQRGGQYPKGGQYRGQGAQPQRGGPQPWRRGDQHPKGGQLRTKGQAQVQKRRTSPRTTPATHLHQKASFGTTRKRPVRRRKQKCFRRIGHRSRSWVRRRILWAKRKGASTRPGRMRLQLRKHMGIRTQDRQLLPLKLVRHRQLSLQWSYPELLFGSTRMLADFRQYLRQSRPRHRAHLFAGKPLAGATKHAVGGQATCSGTGIKGRAARERLRALRLSLRRRFANLRKRLRGGRRLTKAQLQQRRRSRSVQARQRRKDAALRRVRRRRWLHATENALWSGARLRRQRHLERRLRRRAVQAKRRSKVKGERFTVLPWRTAERPYRRNLTFCRENLSPGSTAHWAPALVTPTPADAQMTRRVLVTRSGTRPRVRYLLRQIAILDPDPEMAGREHRFLLIKRRFRGCSPGAVLAELFGLLTPPVYLRRLRVGHRSRQRTLFRPVVGAEVTERHRVLFGWLRDFVLKNSAYNHLRRNTARKRPAKSVPLAPQRARRLTCSLKPRFGAELRGLLEGDAPTVEQLNRYDDNTGRVPALTHYRWELS
jgi:hypothetical protein